MTEFDSVTRSVISYAPSYKTVACDEIELNGNADYQQAHHSTWRIKDRTSHNYRVNKKHLWNITWEEVKLVPWKWMIYRFCSHILPIITIIGLIVLLSIMSLPGFLESYAVCKPDGTFSLSYDGYTPWKRDAIFAIDMGFGSFSFGVAKLIDVSWDLVSLLVLLTARYKILRMTLGSWKRSAGTALHLCVQNFHKSSVPYYGVFYGNE